MTKLVRTLKGDHLSDIKDLIFVVIQLIDPNEPKNLQICDNYVAIREQITKFIAALSRLLGQHENSVSTEVQKFVEFVVKGFENQKFTLQSSAYTFECLCKHCAPVLSPFTSQLSEQILTQEFVTSWSYNDESREIVIGFSYLINHECLTNMEACGPHL